VTEMRPVAAATLEFGSGSVSGVARHSLPMDH